MVASKRSILALVLAAAAAAVCVRLGFWQLDRLDERRSYNALLLERLGEPELPFTALPADTAAGHYRRVMARGTFMYDREIVWAPRMRRSSPGVNILTPLRLAGTDTVVLVNRGWVYSPDAKSIEFGRWREADTVVVAGYVETWAHACAAANSAALPPNCADSASRVLRRLDGWAAQRLVGAPVAPYLLMQTSDSMLRADSIPARVETPVLDEGPHLNYALQWFAFATIALVVGVALARTGKSG